MEDRERSLVLELRGCAPPLVEDCEYAGRRFGSCAHDMLSKSFVLGYDLVL